MVMMIRIVNWGSNMTERKHKHTRKTCMYETLLTCYYYSNCTSVKPVGSAIIPKSHSRYYSDSLVPPGSLGG